MTAPVRPPQMWRRFVRDHWRRRPYHHRRFGPLVDPDLLFAATVAGAGSLVETTVRIVVGTERVEDRWFLPKRSDGDFAGWHRRAVERAGGAAVALIVNPLQHKSFELWRALAAQLEELFRITGLPPYGVEAGVFVGDYDATPFGVHTDEVDVVMGVVRGRKRVLVWAPDTLDRERAARYRPGEAHRVGRRPRVIEARAGDVVYWPAGFWHVAETRGFSVSVNLAIGAIGRTPSAAEGRGTPAAIAAAAVRAVLEESSPTRALRLAPRSRATERIGLDRALRRTLAPLTAAVLDGGLERRLIGEQLARTTALGFLPGPPLAEPVELTAETRLARDPSVELHSCLVGGTLVVAACGRSWSVPAHPALVALPGSCASRARTVAEIVAPFPALVHGPDGRDAIVDRALVVELLRSLCRARALIPAMVPARRRAWRERK